MTNSETRAVEDIAERRAMPEVSGQGAVSGSRIGLAAHRPVARRAGACRPAKAEILLRRSSRMSDPERACRSRGHPANERGLIAKPLLPALAGFQAMRSRWSGLLVLGMLAAHPDPAISQESSWATSCPPPLKLAAGACVRSCPAGYADAERTCVFQDMSH